MARFNREGVGALDPRHGGGATVQYGPGERERILREFRRSPDRERDGTATWSLTTLQRALQRAPERGWNAAPTVFEWGGQRARRRERARARRHALGGSGAVTRRPIARRSRPTHVQRPAA